MRSIWTPGRVNSRTELLERAVLNNLEGHPMDSQELSNCIFCSIGEFYQLNMEDLGLLPDTINNLITFGKIGVRARPMETNSLVLKLELFSTLSI